MRILDLAVSSLKSRVILALKTEALADCFRQSIDTCGRLKPLMLRNTQLPLSEIAAAMGFADQSHLTRHFHRLTGVAPSLLRWNAC